jgi:peptidoglycan/LPS O-acetylase OafA/YrhL
LGYPIFMANGTQFVWGYTLVNVACAYLLVLAIQDRFVSRLMQFPPFILTGRISYGIYFYHHPLVYLQLLGAKRLTPLFGSYWAAFLVLLPLCVAAIYGLAWASYRYFESPFLRLKDRPFWRSGASAGRLEPPVRTEGAGRPEPRPAEVQN